jgi:hypothetical protein
MHFSDIEIAENKHQNKSQILDVYQ